MRAMKLAGRHKPVILESAILNIKPGQSADFERAFVQASPIVASAHGYMGHELRRCIETADRYILLIRWETLDDHVVGFRQSPAFLEWKSLLHHFYEPFPTVEHFQLVYANQAENQGQN